MQVENRRYYFRDVKRFGNAIKISKVGDNGKRRVEKRAFEYLEKYLNEKDGKTFNGMPALQTTAVDRYGMGKAMRMRLIAFGDFMFAPVTVCSQTTPCVCLRR